MSSWKRFSRIDLSRRRRVVMDWTEHIHSDPEVVHGEPVFRGTRVPVSVVLDALANGTSPDDLLRSYPSLGPHHLNAALAYAAHLAREFGSEV
jgi:uncharacterized protein (DUF433 family)